MQTEFHKLVLAEVLAQFVVHRVIDGEMIGGEELGKPQGGSLGGRQILGFRGSFQRADRVLVEAVVDGALITHRDAASALVEERDAQSHQFEQSGRQRSVGAQRRGQRAQRLGHCGKATHDAGDAEVDPVSLTEILCGHCGEGRRRRDSCHFMTPVHGTACLGLLKYRRRRGPHATPLCRRRYAVKGSPSKRSRVANSADRPSSQPRDLAHRFAQRHDRGDGVRIGHAEEIFNAWLLGHRHRGQHPAVAFIARRQQHVPHERVHRGSGYHADAIEVLIGGGDDGEVQADHQHHRRLANRSRHLRGRLCRLDRRLVDPCRLQRIPR